MSNTITAYFKGRVGVAESLYQYDYGMVLVLDSVDFDSVFEAYFETTGDEDATPVIGSHNRVAIPNSCLQNPGNVTVHIPVHTGLNDSEVEFIVTFRVIGRARPIYDGTPSESTDIAKAIAVLQNIQGDVDAWLDEHPEATTSVQDYSLTLKKLVTGTLGYVTPEMFGAKGDGITDDTEAIEAALAFSKDYSVEVKFPAKVYATTGIELEAGMFIDFDMTVLKALSEDSVIFIDDTNNQKGGSVKNLIIDHNHTAEIGMQIDYCWRWIFENIIFRNVGTGGTSLKVGTGTGSVFRNIRGVSSSAYTGTTLMEILNADMTFDCIDWQSYQIGIKTSGFNTFSNIHGYVAKTEIYDGSVFMQINGRIMATNLYPDGQQHMFEFTARACSLLANVYAVFSDSLDIDTETYGNPILFYSDNANTTYRTIVQNVYIECGSEKPIQMYYPNSQTIKVTNISVSSAQTVIRPSLAVAENIADTDITIENTSAKYTGDTFRWFPVITLNRNYSTGQSPAILKSLSPFNFMGIYIPATVIDSSNHVVGQTVFTVSQINKTLSIVGIDDITLSGYKVFAEVPMELTYEMYE